MIRKGQDVALLQADGKSVATKVASLFLFENLGRREVDEVAAGDVCAVVGLEDAEIGDTISDKNFPIPLPRLFVDEPTLEMIFYDQLVAAVRPRGQIRDNPAAAGAFVS